MVVLLRLAVIVRDVMALGDVVKCASLCSFGFAARAHRPLIFRDANVINNSAFKRNEISRAEFTHTTLQSPRLQHTHMAYPFHPTDKYTLNRTLWHSHAHATHNATINKTLILSKISTAFFRYGHQIANNRNA